MVQFQCLLPLLKPALTLGRNVLSGGETKLGLTDFGVNGAAKIAVKVNLARMPGSHEIRRAIGSKILLSWGHVY